MLLDTKKFKVIKNSLTNNLERELATKLKDKGIPEIKDIILNNYETLALYRMHKDSKLHLKDFYDDLKDLLDDHLYIKIDGGTISFVVPDITTIEESKTETLKVLLVIAEGLAGRYVELDDSERFKLGLATHNGLGFVINNKNVYLYRRTTNLIKAMKTAGIKIKRWPFSKPEDIFIQADEFVSDNIDSWLRDVVERSRRELIREYR